MTAPDGPEMLSCFACGEPSRRTPTAEAVGGKALSLIRMAAAGLPVPPGFVLTTELYRRYDRAGHRLPEGTPDLLIQGIREVEAATGLTFGGVRRPLLVAVRSGAPVSMPGMMDTLLNVGLSGRTLPGLIRMTGNPRHARDSYRRLVASYAEIVGGQSPDPFARLLAEHLRREGVPEATELDAAALEALTRGELDAYERIVGHPFPQEPLDQLTGAVEAVLRSWEGPRATAYRRRHGLDAQMGTAVTVQAMVFGNTGGTSGSGVAFTRDPTTGEDTLYSDFLPDAQGEDLVSGRYPVQGPAHLAGAGTELDRRLREIGRRLERLFGDAQDFEFAVQEGRLFLLQSRAAQRTSWAALRIACDLVREGLIDERAALARLAGHDLAAIRCVRLAPSERCRPIGRGIPASPGLGVGVAEFDPERALEQASSGHPPILVRRDVSTADFAALAASAGLLTARGGRTSHAAVVARQLEKPCVVGCRDLVVRDDGRGGRIGDRQIGEGEVLCLDGQTGSVYVGRPETVVDRPTPYLREVERWKVRIREGVQTSPDPDAGSESAGLRARPFPDREAPPAASHAGRDPARGRG